MSGKGVVFLDDGVRAIEVVGGDDRVLTAGCDDHGGDHQVAGEADCVLGGYLLFIDRNQQLGWWLRTMSSALIERAKTPDGVIAAPTDRAGRCNFNDENRA